MIMMKPMDRSRVVEPSEIIDREGLPKEKVTHIQPQIRLLARFFDYGIFFLVLLGLQALMGNKYPSDLFGHVIPFEFFAWIPLEALFLKFLGRTPGKFFLRIRIRQGRRHYFDFITALRRSFNVWFRGLGMGIAFINIICMLLAANRLKMLGSTSWDREDNITVSHYPISQTRIIIAVLFTFCSCVAYYGIKHEFF